MRKRGGRAAGAPSPARGQRPGSQWGLSPFPHARRRDDRDRVPRRKCSGQTRGRLRLISRADIESAFTDTEETGSNHRGSAYRADGGTSGTLVTEILGAPQREIIKEKQIKSGFVPHLSAQGCYAGTQFFDCLGKTQGRRSCRFPPDRFARPPHLRTGGTPVRLGAFSLPPAQREENLPGASF